MATNLKKKREYCHYCYEFIYKNNHCTFDCIKLKKKP